MARTGLKKKSTNASSSANTSRKSKGRSSGSSGGGGGGGGQTTTIQRQQQQQQSQQRQRRAAIAAKHTQHDPRQEAKSKGRSTAKSHGDDERRQAVDRDFADSTADRGGVVSVTKEKEKRRGPAFPRVEEQSRKRREQEQLTETFESLMS